MRSHALRFVTVTALMALGCDDAESEDASSSPPADGGPDAAVPPSCAAGELTLPDGDCQPPGVPADQCHQGFETDGHAGCTPILPQMPCGQGEMAVPGEPTCRPVGPCPDGTWGDIATDASTQHVDASYRGGASDGSASGPWTTIQQAIDAAPSGGLVAIAEGSYLEDLTIGGKPVELRGRCAALVEIVATGEAPDAVAILGGGDGSTIADVAVTGPGVAVRVQSAADVTLDRVWMHDLDATGVAARGGAEVTVTRCLIDGASADGVLVASGSSATVEATVIRGITPVQSTATGVYVTSGGAAGTRPSASVRASVIEGIDGAGVFIEGSDALVEGSLVRDTFHAEFGWAIAVQDDVDSGARASVEVAGCVIERSQDSGVFVAGSDLTMERSVVQATSPHASGLDRGIGITAQASLVTGDPATLVLRASLLQGNHAAGCDVAGSIADIDATLVRDTRAQQADGRFGRGLNVSDVTATGARSSLTIRNSIVEQSHDVGLLVDLSDALVENVAIRDTQPRAYDGLFGRGIQIQGTAGELARATVLRSLVEHNRDIGIAVVDSDVVIDEVIVLGTQPTTMGTYGDGIAGAWLESPVHVSISRCRVEGNARAGVASFAASLEIADTVLECNAIQLDREPADNAPPFVVEDRGGNVCGCGGQTEACTIETSSLVPPQALSE